MSVEKGLDEPWVEVKFQSNAGIAGSPRNSFRAGVRAGFREVERWTGEGERSRRTTPNSECPESAAGSQAAGDKSRRREGKSPDRPLRSQRTG